MTTDVVTNTSNSKSYTQSQLIILSDL